MKADARHRGGFTLIELLISISIISLLISILVPALSESRRRASRALCLTHLRELYLAHAAYIGSDERFPALNNMPDDGTWQYNYLIFDGRDFESNFGPLARPGGIIADLDILYCPVQTDPWYVYNTQFNRWPVVPLLDTRAAYARRYHISGKSFSQLRTIAFLADVLHLTGVIESAHVTGVNVAYSDGHCKWVRDPGILTDNDMGHPFDAEDNPIMEDIWDALDEAP